LEESLLAEGYRDAVVIWKQEKTLLDGRHRLPICKKHTLKFSVKEMDLPDRAAALQWIRANQIGRRNLTPDAVRYLRGQHYNAEKKPHGGDRKSVTTPASTCGRKATTPGARPERSPFDSIGQ
jgi:hypothetical protein